jgi:hypothetical protein
MYSKMFCSMFWGVGGEERGARGRKGTLWHVLHLLWTYYFNASHPDLQPPHWVMEE